MSSMQKVDRYLETHMEESIAELSRLCAQPSVAAQNWGLRECSALVAEMLKARGFAVQILGTGGAPVVFGERKGKSDRTVLFYNHYDVQPAEPLELWDSPAFEPTLRDGKLYARGVSDDKGHLGRPRLRPSGYAAALEVWRAFKLEDCRRAARNHSRFGPGE